MAVEEAKNADAATGDRRHRLTKMKFGKTKDTNLWPTETRGKAKYPLELFIWVITVRLETLKIVKGLMVLEIP